MRPDEKGKTMDSYTAWERFVRGDENAFKYVFHSYFTSMYGYGIKLCDQPELVKDCIQELFSYIWERRDALTHIESPNVYLFVSLRRSILRKVESQKATSRGFEEAGELGFTGFSKEELIIRNEVKFQQKEKLKEALNQLPDRQQEVIYLHFYNGMSYGEIEQILSINRQSVRNHMYRAMEALRTLLDTEIMKLVISLLVSILLFL